MKETLLLLFLKDGVTNNFISYQKDHSPVKGNLKYSCNIKKKEKKLALIISLLFLDKAKVSQNCFIITQNFLSSYH